MNKLCTICKSDKDISDFNKKKSNKDGLQNVCRDCSNINSKLYYTKHKAKHRQSVAARKHKIRQEFRNNIKSIKELNPCPCGENEVCCLEFHHTSGRKEFNISEALNRDWKWQRVYDELLKCVVLCSNCHKKKHAGKRVIIHKIKLE